MDFADPENFHTPHHWKVQEGVGLKIKANWNFWRGEGVQTKNLSVGRVGVFSGTTHLMLKLVQSLRKLK